MSTYISIAVLLAVALLTVGGLYLVARYTAVAPDPLERLPFPIRNSGITVPRHCSWVGTAGDARQKVSSEGACLWSGGEGSFHFIDQPGRVFEKFACPGFRDVARPVGG